MKSHYAKIRAMATANSWLKLRYFLASCLVITTAFIITYSYITASEMINSAVGSATGIAADIAETTKKRTLNTAMDQLMTKAKAKAFQARVELDEAMGVADTLAKVLSGMKSAGVAVDVGRDSVNSMLRTILENNKNFLAAYTAWEPDAFDMLDLAFANARGYDKTGRFIPYWYRSGKNNIILVPLKDYENMERYKNSVRKGEYYLGPRETGTAHITDPYPRVIGDKKVLITSIVVPVMVDDTFQGIAGIDLKLDFLQKLADEAGDSLFMGKGKVMFISNNGTLAAISGTPGHAGKHMKTLCTNWNREIRHIVSGEPVTRTDNNQVLVLTPLRAEHTATPWSVRIVIPKEIIQAEALTIHKKMMNQAESLDKLLSSKISRAIRKQMSVAAILIISVLLIITLIRTLEKKEKALKESEARLQAILDNASAVIYLKDAKGRYLLVNRQWEELFNFAKERVVGKSEYEFFPKDVADEFQTNDKKVLEAGFPLHLEETVPLHDGIHTYISVKFPMYDSNGILCNVCGISTDITERKRAENELQKLKNYLNDIINSMPSVLVGTDSEERVTHWNLMAEKTTGIAAEKAEGQPLVKVFPQLTEHMEKVRETIWKQKPQKAEKVMSLIQGKICYSDIMIYPLMTNGVQGSVLRVDDITARVQFEDMMVQTEKMMSVGGLAAGMAHEINNPLGGILQSAQNILRRISSELSANEKIAQECGTDLKTIQSYLKKRDIVKFLEGIRESGEKASEIVTNMLNFSRQSESQMAPVSLPKVLDNTVALAAHDYDLKKKYDFRNIEIVRDFSSDLPEVFCTATEIEQVILNLLRNSAQAMSEKKCQEDIQRIILRLRQDGNMARIEVEDNGPGMSEEIRKRIFEPFFTTKEVGTGTGLGLSVSYFIITSNHKGSITVESDLGKGTRFVIHIPLKRMKQV